MVLGSSSVCDPDRGEVLEELSDLGSLFLLPHVPQTREATMAMKVVPTARSSIIAVKVPVKVPGSDSSATMLKNGLS